MKTVDEIMQMSLDELEAYKAELNTQLHLIEDCYTMRYKAGQRTTRQKKARAAKSKSKANAPAPIPPTH